MYVEVSQDLVHVLHEGSSHKYLGRHIPGNLKQRGRVELHHRKTIAWAKFNKHRTILTNKHVSFLLKLRLKFFNAVVTPAMLFSLHTLALTKVQLESINVLQRKMLRSIVGWVRVNGEDWSETMRRMNHRLGVALELFPLPPWTEQLAKRQFQFAARVASEQSWSSVVGHCIGLAAGWQANFDSMPSRKRGRPLVKWDDKLSNITSQFFPLHHGWLAAAKMPFRSFLAKCAAILCFTFCGPLGLHYPPCPYGIVVVVFHFDSGGRKAKKNTLFASVRRKHGMPFLFFADVGKKDHFIRLFVFLRGTGLPFWFEVWFDCFFQLKHFGTGNLSTCMKEWKWQERK